MSHEPLREDYPDDDSYYEAMDAFTQQDDPFDSIYPYYFTDVNFSPDPDRVSSLNSSTTIWKKNNLGNIISALRLLASNEDGQRADFLRHHIDRSAAAKLLPKDLHVNDLVERMAEGVSHTQSTGLGRWEAPPLTPWQDVARCWLILNAIDIPERTERPQFEVSEVYYDFNAQASQDAIRSAVIQEHLHIRRNDDIGNIAVARIVGSPGRNRGAVYTEALRKSGERIKRLRKEIEEMDPEDIYFRSLKQKDLEVEIAIDERIAEIGQRFSELDTRAVDHQVKEATLEFNRAQDAAIAAAAEFKQYADRFIQTGTAIPSHAIEHIWNEDPDDPQIWQRDRFARRVFRHLPRPGHFYMFDSSHNRVPVEEEAG